MDAARGKARFVVVSKQRRGPSVGRGVGGAVDRRALACLDTHVSTATCHFGEFADDPRMVKSGLRIMQHTMFVSKGAGGRPNCQSTRPEG